MLVALRFDALTASECQAAVRGLSGILWVGW